MSASQGTPAGAVPRSNGNVSVSNLLNLLRTLGDKTQQQSKTAKAPQSQQQTARQRVVPAKAPQAASYQPQARSQLPPPPSSGTYQPTFNYSATTLHDAALQAQSTTTGQGYTAPPLPNIQVGGQAQAGSSRVRFAPEPATAVVPNTSNRTNPTPQAPSQPAPAPAQSRANVAQTNMQILQNMFKNTNASASRQRQNALVGLLESIRSGKGINIGRPSQIRPGVSSQGGEPSRKRRRMETPGTSRFREPYVYDPVPRHSSGSGFGDNEYHSTADDDDEPVGRPFGPWLPSQIGPDGELLPRKRGRQRILTPEEALARRKERNRLAAQESRRRKAQQLSGTVRKVGELGGELEQTKSKFDEMTKSHADLQKKYNDLERAHQQLRRDYDILQDQQNQITTAIEQASRLGEEEFQDFSSAEEDQQHPIQEETEQAQSRRGGSVAGDRGDNVISINGVDMNIDEYLAFSLAAAQAAQEDAAAQENGMEHDENEQEMHDGEDGLNQAEHYDGESGAPDTPIASVQAFDASNTADTPIVIDPALEQYSHPAHNQPKQDSNSVHTPIDVDADEAVTPAETNVATDTQSAATDFPSEVPPAQVQQDAGDMPEAGRDTAATEAPPSEVAAMDVEFDDDEDDGDFIPENELAGGQDDEQQEDDDNESGASPDVDVMPAQTQDSVIAQATQNPSEMEEEQDDEDDDDDEYFRIEEADYEDLFQPIEDVPIPVEDYLEIQAQYQRHLEEFNATLLRQQVAEMIANEDATGSGRGEVPPGTDVDDPVEEERQRQAYQDTLESLGIAPEASQAQ
ncbi:hypothetical protein NliqN6_3340 [Naganishia liquefaciens]|uniref:BZIP domain-containing protein n=1 Tax=Naganishia liquefaciens TaxID=104408 RepID=A0A8H3TTQ7_9TREE|nr:hypothetical protein NliqN6_3340 [Naganishia liquefaciens]